MRKVPLRCVGPILVLLSAILTSAGTAGPSARAVGPFPDSSLYQLGSTWVTDEGRKIRLAELAGKRRLFTLFFSHCEASCPMALGRLKSLEAKLPKDWTTRSSMVMVTLDPARDDSGSLADFRRRMSLGKEGWLLLRGGPEDTRELAMLMGVAYRPSTANGGIEHNSVLVLLDTDGVVLKRYEGADPGPEFMEDLGNGMDRR